MADPLTGGFEVAKCLFAPCLAPCSDAVSLHCSYVTSYDDYVGKLEHQASKLFNEKQTQERRITDAKCNGLTIYDNFEDWVREAGADYTEAQRVLNANRTATRFHGWLLNPEKRYRLGKDGKTIADRIEQLLGRIPSGPVCDDGAPPGRVDGAPDVNSSVSDGGDTIADSRASLFQGIMKALDDEKLKVIGVYGRGGVGKTTLLEEVEKKLRKEGRPFKMIAKSTVSQNPDVKKIQDDIAYFFSLNLNDVPSEVGRRDRLSKILKDDPKEKEKEEVPKEKEKFLIILDDLWDTLDLKKVGIPLGDESNKCQLLLTSRDKNVLEQKMGAHPTFHLEGLSNEEAFRLFEKTYGPDKLKDEGYEARAAKLVAKLAGLPLLINSVASTLKCGEESTWDTALIKIEDPNIKSIVEWSYGRLKSHETESLFLLCGFVGGSIPVELLLGLGMGLSLFKGFDMTIQNSRSKLNEMLRRLRSICLLQDGDKENVTIHDLYSEVVVSTPLTGQNSLMTHPEAGSWPKKKLEKCWVCLVNVGSDGLAELRLHRFPDSKVFLLSERRDMRDYDVRDFTSMKELRVLYLRSIKFNCVRSSVKIPQNLQSLYLHNCKVEDVRILGNLQTLQILSFAGSTISMLPKEIGNLTKLKLLNLSPCYHLKKIEHGALKGLINLEELYMRESFDQWMGEDGISSELCNAKLADLKSLTKLTALEISIPEPTVLLEDGELPFGERFWINIGNAHGREFEGLTTMMLNLEVHDRILSKDWVQKTLQQTQYLYLDGLREFEKSAYELCSQRFLQLKHLEIRNCSSIKHIAISSNGALPLLESLFLENLTNLETICDGPKCFSKLKDMRVAECNRLKYLWRLSQMHNFIQLEKIIVCRCNSIQAIVIDDARDDIVVDNRVELPNVRHLELAELPNVRHLELAELPKMMSFCIAAAGITSDGAPIQLHELPNLRCMLQFILVFPNLKELQVTNTGLAFLFPIFVAKCVGEIRDIELRDCEKMQALVVDEDGRDEGTNDIIEFPLLKRLKISNCPMIKSFSYFHGKKKSVPIDVYSNSFFDQKVSLPSLEQLCLDELGSFKSMWPRELPNSSFDNLAKLEVRWCSKLLNVFYSTITGRLYKLRSVLIKNCPSLETVFECGSLDSNTTEQTGVVPVSDSQTVLALPNLECVSVGDCFKLRYLFPCAVASLEKLESLLIRNCEQMKEVIAKEEGGQSKAGVLSFPVLTSLSIFQCPNLGAFIPNPPSVERSSGKMVKESDESRQPFFNKMVAFPTLSNIEIEGVHVKELWNNQIHHNSFWELRSLKLRDCDNLQQIAPFYVWEERLKRCLQILEVRSCRSIKIIYESDVTVAKNGELRSLVLHDLQNLTQIWRCNIVPFPNLRDVMVNTCPRLRVLFETFTASFLGQIERLWVVSCDDMDLIADRGECDGATSTTVTFFKLKELRLVNLPKFRGYLPENSHAKFPSPSALFVVGCGKVPDQSDPTDRVHEEGKIPIAGSI